MNKTVISITRFVVLATFAAVTAGCEAEKSKNPLSPNVAGPIAGVSITAPAPIAPANGAEVVNTEPLRLVIRNAASNGERPFWYMVELASDPAFNQKVYTNPKVTPAPGDHTTVVVGATLTAESTYFWRVKADDGANASDFSSAAHFDLVVPVVIDAPVPVSPANGETVPNNTPELVVANGRVQGRAGTVEYKFEVARDAGFGNVVSVAFRPRSGSGRTTHQTLALPSGALLYWRATGTNGLVTSAPSAVQSFRTPAAPAPPGPGPGPVPPPGVPGRTPGCINGVLADPRAYFFALIGRSEGQPAGDWYSVLQRSGLPAGPVRGQKFPPNAPFFGISQQINSSGQLRGRLHLPTDIPNDHGYYIHDVDILSDASGSTWVWRPLGGPPYAPRPCN